MRIWGHFFGVALILCLAQASAGTAPNPPGLTRASLSHCKETLDELAEVIPPKSEESKKPLCSVVIPSYNGRHLLEGCLASMEKHRPKERSTIEIIVADDASSDGTLEWIRKSHPDVRVVRLKQNAGFCGASNCGIAASRAPFIQMLNNDTEVLSGWIENGLRLFTNPKVGAVSPLVRIHSEPDLVDSAGDSYASLMGWAFRRGRGEKASEWEKKESDSVLLADGSSSFYRRNALEKVGLFDPSFGAYYEDVDLSFRLRHAGFDIVFAPQSQILHKVSSSYDHSSKKLHRKIVKNSETLFWSDLPAGRLAFSAMPHIGLTVARGTYASLRGRGASFWAGRLDALKDYRSIWARRKEVAKLREDAIGPSKFPMYWLAVDEFLRQAVYPRFEKEKK